MSRYAISAIQWDAARQHIHAVFSHLIVATQEGQPDALDKGAWVPVTSIEVHMLNGDTFWLVRSDEHNEPVWGDQLRLGQHGQIESYDSKGAATDALAGMPTTAPD